MSDIKGYRKLSEEEIAAVNIMKKMEEHVLRALDNIQEMKDVDMRSLALARTNIQQGFMWGNRAIMRPQRLEIDSDVKSASE